LGCSSPRAPAYAHGADAPDATNYRVTITAQPALVGVDVRTIEAGARLQLTNHSGRNVEVLGYQNEPYLEIRPDGVYQNYHSPAAYLNITIAHVDPPTHADPTVPPVWQKVSDEPMYRWHDQRVLWTAPRPPGDPKQPHHVRDWTVPMRVDALPLTLAGSLDWVPPAVAVAVVAGRDRRGARDRGARIFPMGDGAAGRTLRRRRRARADVRRRTGTRRGQRHLRCHCGPARHRPTVDDGHVIGRAGRRGLRADPLARAH
jgi:hypothetical protein